MPDAVTWCGRTFGAADLALMREIAHDYAALAVTEIARTICDLVDWTRPNGRLKDHECRLLLEHLQAQGVLTLPPIRRVGGGGPRRIRLAAAPAVAPAPIEGLVRDWAPLSLALVVGTADSRRWRECMERYHYLGCCVPFGAHLRYWVRARDRDVACLLWTSAAWKMRARDAWIGWSDAQRRQRLPWLVNNGRFLMLPWVRIPGLASKILALSARHLPDDWAQHYGCRPLLLETLVDPARFHGTCYRAANWIYVGQTAGRGRMDRDHKAHGRAVKDIYIYPLAPDARQRLCGDLALTR